MPQNLTKQQQFRVLGLMSGTSLDGLDLCLVDFRRMDTWQFEIKAAKTMAYSDAWEADLKFKPLSDSELKNLDHRYGKLLAHYVLDFLGKENIDPKSIDFIASHGHTWYHQPEKGLGLQIGNGPELWETSQIPVICDFRKADIALGGQGAPLVPIGDRDLFSEYDACLNLGGFANISFSENGQRIAFDIVACNLILNHYSRKLGLPYDDGGYIAATHKCNSQLLQELNQLAYYQQRPPKSLGIEWLREIVFPILEKARLSPEEIIATATEHSAYQIARCLNDFGLNKVLLSGGGSYNQTLIDTIGLYSQSKLLIAAEPINSFKEALIFAYLGLLKHLGEDNILASVTGAPHNHCSGTVYPK